jgi:raffinose/stachyose/melibiose transport system permease protein
MKNRSPWSVFKYTLFLVSTILVVFPLFFVFLSSFKNNEEIFSGAFSFPSRIHFENYINLFNDIFHFHTYFINSFFYAAFVCALSAIVNTMAAYAIGRLKWKLSKVVMGLFLSGLMIPLHAIIVPLYIFVSRFNMPNQIALMLLFTASAIPISVFLIAGFLNNVPRALEESAVIDGCTIPGMFFKIVIPIIKPAIATVTIFNFMAVWNDLMLSLIFLNEEKLKTLQLGMLRFKSSFYSDYGLILAAIVVSIIPSIIVYLSMSDKLISGITSGAIKG